MPMFDFQCQECGIVKEVFLRKVRRTGKCGDCGGKTKRLFTLGRRAQPESPIWSTAMGVAPDQIREMNAIYPDHEYHPQTGDLRVMNAKHRDKLAADIGLTVLS